MTGIYALTALDAVRLVTPYATLAIAFALFTWLMCYITEVRVNRRWLRDPDNMERTVKDQLARKDVAIKEWQKENKELRADNERMAAIIRGVQSRVMGEAGRSKSKHRKDYCL